MKSLALLLATLLLNLMGYASPCNCFSLYFDKDQAKLTQQAIQQLKQLQKADIEKVWLYGHADSDGSEAYNLTLSEKRVASVEKTLSDLAIETFPYGESKPLNSNSSEAEKALNRRVELCYLRKGTFLPQLSAPQVQRFTINQANDTLLLGKQGTQLYLPKGIFAADSSLPLEIELIELYDKADMVLANVSTLTASKELLETSGMLYINARQNGKAIILKESSNYYLRFKEQPEGYRLYQGDTLQQTIQWTLEEDLLSTIEVAEQPAEFPGGFEALSEFLRKNLRYPKTAQRNGIGGTVFVEFIIDTTGQLHSPKIIQGIGFGCNEEALRVVQLMPEWIPAQNQGSPVAIKQGLPINFTLIGNDTSKFIIEETPLSTGSYSTKIRDAVISSIPKEALQSSSLGWKNLDKLFLYNEPISLTIKALPDTYLSLVFQNQPIIFSGYTYQKDRYRYNRLPREQAIRIIAWKRQGADFLLSIKEASTSDGQITNLDFQSVSEEEAIQLIRQERKSLTP